MKELKFILNERRNSKQLTYKQIQEATNLGYNTVRRVFINPMSCRIDSVVRVGHVIGLQLRIE